MHIVFVLFLNQSSTSLIMKNSCLQPTPHPILPSWDNQLQFMQLFHLVFIFVCINNMLILVLFGFFKYILSSHFQLQNQLYLRSSPPTFPLPPSPSLPILSFLIKTRVIIYTIMTLKYSHLSPWHTIIIVSFFSNFWFPRSQ